MIVLWVYLALTAVVSFLWFLFVGIDESKKHPIGVTIASLAIIAAVWPILACAVIACIALSFLTPPAPRIR